MRNVRDLPASLDLLRGFEAAARLLSFTEAAGELHLTQSAISRQVHQLEEQLGVPLFERRTRSLALTAAGEAYFLAVARALRDLRDATAAVRARSDAVVRVTTTVTFAALWLIPRLTDFQARHPDIPVHVLADNSVRDLQRAALDVAIRYASAGDATAGAIRLFGEQVAPVCSPEFLRRHAIERPQDLSTLPLIDFQDPEARSPWLSWKVWFEAMKLPPPRTHRGTIFSLYDQAIQAALAGQGVALGRVPLVNRLLEDGRLVMPLRGSHAASAGAERAYWVLAAPAAAQRPQVQAFVRWLQQQTRKSQARTTKPG